MEDVTQEDWGRPLPQGEERVHPFHNPFLEPLPVRQVEETPPPPNLTGEFYSNGHPKTDNFFHDLWTMPNGEFLVVKDVLGPPPKEKYKEEEAMPILEEYWQKLEAGLVENAANRKIGSNFNNEELNLFTDEELGEQISRRTTRDHSGEGIERLLQEQGDTIKRGLDARDEELGAEETRIRELLDLERPSNSQPAGRPTLLGAALHLFKTSPKTATRVDLHRIAAQRQALNATRQQILAAHELFAKDALICVDSTAGLNAAMQVQKNLQLTKFFEGVSEVAAADGVTKGHVFGRVNDPMDADERLQPLRDIQKEVNASPLFQEDALRLGAASARATRASRLLADLLNNEGLMSAESFKAVSVAAENVSDKLPSTEFPVETAMVHPENSHLKDSVKQFAEISQKIAEAIIAAIRGLASGMRGTAAEAGEPGVDI